MENDSPPLWAKWLAGTVLTLLPIGFAIGKLWVWARKNRREQQSQDWQLMEQQASQTRKTALDEAALTIARQSEENADLRREVKEARTEERKALDKAAALDTKLAAATATLKVVLAWAKRKGMPMTPELEHMLEGDAP